ALLSRASTSYFASVIKGVDGRDISAFTRVFNALCPAMTRRVCRSLRQLVLIPPALAPHLLADHAGNPRVARLRRDHATLGLAAGDLQHELAAGRFLELVAIVDGKDEGARTADDAVLVVDVEVLDIHRERVGPLEHDRQPVDGDAGR